MSYREVVEKLITAGAKTLLITNILSGNKSSVPASLKTIGRMLDTYEERGLQIKIEVIELHKGFEPPLNEQLAAYFAIQEERFADYRYCPDCGRPMEIEGNISYCEYCEG